MNIGHNLRAVLAQELPFFMATPALVWQLMLLYIPMLLIMFYSIIDTTQFGLQNLTLDHYALVFDPIYWSIILRSSILGISNAIICVILAYPVAYYLAFYGKRLKNVLLFFLILPFWISFLVQIYAWFFVLEKHGLLNSFLIKVGLLEQPLYILNTPFAVSLVMIYCYLPFAIMPIYTALEKFDKRLLEASADLGASQWQTFRRITLPLSALGIRTGFFLVLVPSFGEFIIPALLGGGKQLYTGTLISHYFLLARNFNVGAAFTCVSGAVLLMICVFWYFLFKYMFGLDRRT